MFSVPQLYFFFCRYCLSVIALDQTGEAEFTLFGSLAEQVIGCHINRVIANNQPAQGPIVNAEIAARQVCCGSRCSKFLQTTVVVHGPKSWSCFSQSSLPLFSWHRHSCHLLVCGPACTWPRSFCTGTICSWSRPFYSGADLLYLNDSSLHLIFMLGPCWWPTGQVKCHRTN